METYTAEQLDKDAQRMCDEACCSECLAECHNNGIGIHCTAFVRKYPSKYAVIVREWAASRPEKPKVTNGDKFREVFGHKNWVKCYAESIPNCPVDDCEECEYGINGEYKEPK